MCCGKSTVGRHLAKLTKRDFIDTDAYIEEKVGLTVSEIFRTYSEAFFRELEKECVNEIIKYSNCVIATGGGTILSPCNAFMLKGFGKIVFLDVPFDVVLTRIYNDFSRPLVEKLDKIALKDLFEDRLAKYQACADMIIDANCNCEKICEDIMACSK